MVHVDSDLRQRLFDLPDFPDDGDVPEDEGLIPAGGELLPDGHRVPRLSDYAHAAVRVCEVQWVTGRRCFTPTRTFEERPAQKPVNLMPSDWKAL